MTKKIEVKTSLKQEWILKSQTIRREYFENMKKTLFCMFASTLIVPMLLISCKHDVDEKKPTKKNVDHEIIILDISQETDWNYMVVGKDGSSMLIDIDESTNIPNHLYVKPDKDSDDGYTMIFKENGLPDKITSNGHIVYFGNFNGYQFDMALIKPDGSIEYVFEVETDIDWDAYNNWDTYNNTNGRFISLNDFSKFLTITKHGIGVAACIAAAVPGWHMPAVIGTCGSYIGGLIVDVVVGEVLPKVLPDLPVKEINELKSLLGCTNPSNPSALLDIIGCVGIITEYADLFTQEDLNFISQKTMEINEVIRKIDGDGLTIIPNELLIYFLTLGIEINSGRNPPNIEGTYLATPLQLVNTTTSTNIADQWDMYVTFSNQNYNKLTISADYTMQQNNNSGPMSSSGADAFIVGTGNKFTVFLDGTREQAGYMAKTVEVFSGEMTASGISNYQWAVFMVDNRGDPLGTWIANGTGYFKRDSDRFSEKIQGLRVIIDMYDFFGDGWNHNGALRININGTNISSARLSGGSFGSYSFFVDTGDVVNIYWTGSTGSYHWENAFIVYFADTPPVPAFNQSSWNGSNAWLFRVQGSLSNADLNQLLGSFTVTTDGVSEKEGKRVIIDMYDFYGDGWNHNGTLRVYKNGAYISNTRLSGGSFGSYSFFVYTGDVVNIYWTGNMGSYHGENAFIVYFADTPPVPVFNPTSWNGSNALLFRVQDSLSNVDLDQMLGSFTVIAAVAPKVVPFVLSGQRSNNVLPSKVSLPETYTRRY